MFDFIFICLMVSCASTSDTLKVMFLFDCDAGELYENLYFDT